MLINSSYFEGPLSIPNKTQPEVAATINHLIALREKEFLKSLLGYELFLLFESGLAQLSPAQRYLDILYGKDYTGFDGRTHRWAGLVSVTTPSQSLNISLTGIAPDIFFTVGDPGAPADNSDTYVNAALVNAEYRVTQRAFGPLEMLKADNSNAANADIQRRPGGGFIWRGTTRFSQGDKYQIEIISNALSVAGVPVVQVAESPIADYVYYWYMRQNHSQSAGVGEVQTGAQNAELVTAAHKMRTAWNNMVDKLWYFYEFMQVNYDVYPEFQHHTGSSNLRMLMKKINAWNL